MAQRLARGAHNSEVTRSKRVAGIKHITSHRCIKALEQPKGTYGYPLTLPFKFGKGVRGDSMSPAIPRSAEEARRKIPSVDITM